MLVAHLVQYGKPALVAWRQGHLQVRDYDAALVEPRLKPGSHVAEPGVAVKRSAVETEAGVEPPQQRFAFAVNRVVDLHVRVGSLAVALDGGHDRLEPLVEAQSRAGRHLEDPRV